MLEVCLPFHNHPPDKGTGGLALHQQAADEPGATLSVGGLRKIGSGTGRAWWLWEWLRVGDGQNHFKETIHGDIKVLSSVNQLKSEEQKP